MYKRTILCVQTIGNFCDKNVSAKARGNKR